MTWINNKEPLDQAQNVKANSRYKQDSKYQLTQLNTT